MAVVGGLFLPTPSPAQSFAAVDRAVREGIARQVFPGAVLVVGRRDTILFARGYGHLTWSARSPRPDPRTTLWDLASLTKVIATTGVAARYVERGLLDLDAPVARYLPGFTGEGREHVTVRMLLDHTSGLPPTLPLARDASTREEALARVLREPLRRFPGTAAEYSDLNAILAGAVLERIGGQRLDLLFGREVAAPLGLGQTAFGVPAGAWSRTAPTSVGPRADLRGTVNDRNAALMDGVAGHAGLFGTAMDVARVAQAWLREGELGGERWLDSLTVRRFLTPATAAPTRYLGWERPDPARADPGQYGRLASIHAFGHLGWTGTQAWADPDADLFVVFLTNRSFRPRRRKTFDALKAVRGAVADAALRSAGRTCLAAPRSC